MIIDKPKVYLIGETRLVEEGLQQYLSDLGIPDWNTDAPSDSEKLAEAGGRMCYRSWKADMNPNVKKVREGNLTYLQNVIKQGHGSVLEHVSVNFIFKDVSRVFTHELVRHRVGVAISQESLRYVRLADGVDLWMPSVFEGDPEMVKLFEQHMASSKDLMQHLSAKYELDDDKTDFHKKKEVTSAMRRLLPDGLATTIMWTANMRTLRHVLEMRTSEGAEEEIRVVFAQVGKLLMERYPNMFGDYAVVDTPSGIPVFKTVNRKV